MELGIVDMIRIILCVSFIVLCFVSILLMLLGYYHERKATKRFEKLREKRRIVDEWRKL